MAEMKDQLNSLREDTSRKSKLVSALREAHATNSTQIDQLTSQLKEADENVKRYLNSYRSLM